MPTYEYRCDKGHEFEVFQRMSEAPVEKCIHCGAKAERQLSAGAGLLFKGSGFYITDNRSDKYKKAAEADKGPTPTPKSADSAKGDSSSKSETSSKSDSSPKGESSSKGDSSTTGSSGSD